MNKVEKIITTLKIGTIGILNPLKAEYPVLLNILSNSSRPLDNWRFFITTGGIAYFIK